MSKFIATLALLAIAVAVNGQLPFSNSTVCVENISQGAPPTQVVDAKDGTLLVLRLPGFVQLLNSTTFAALAGPPLVVVPAAVSAETGAYALAVHPNYATNKKFYIYYTCNQTATNFSPCEAPCADDSYCNGGECISGFCNATNINVLDEFTAGTPTASFNRRITTIPFVQDVTGGGLAFLSNNGIIFLGSGDGAHSNDTFLNAQNINRTAGKILAFDVDTVPASPVASQNTSIPSSNPFIGQTTFPEIYALGVRQPYRINVLPNGDAIFSDVGESLYEELNYLVKGANYGWSAYEGPLRYRTEVNVTVGSLTFGKNLSRTLFPAQAPVAVMAGRLYSGSDTCYKNSYIFGDFSSSLFGYKTLTQVNPDPKSFKCALNSTLPCSDETQKNILSIDQDASGELLFSTLGGLYRTVPLSRCGLQCVSSSSTTTTTTGQNTSTQPVSSSTKVAASLLALFIFVAVLF